MDKKKLSIVLLLVLVVVALFIYKKSLQPAPDTAVTTPGKPAAAETYGQVFAHKLPVLAELGSESCIPCKQMRPVILKLQKDFSGRLTVDPVDVNIESAKTERYSKFHPLRVIPVQLLISADGKLLWWHEGFIPEPELRAVIDEKTGLK